MNKLREAAGEGVDLLPGALGDLPSSFSFSSSFSLSEGVVKGDSFSSLASSPGGVLANSLGSSSGSSLGGVLGSLLGSAEGGQFSVIISLGVGW